MKIPAPKVKPQKNNLADANKAEAIAIILISIMILIVLIW
jgi:hypothetical protein